MATDWTRVDVVADHAAAAAEMVAAYYRDTTLANIGRHIGPKTHMPIESPLEAIFLAWYLAFSALPEFQDRCSVSMQREVIAGGDKFRLDFVVTPALAIVARSAGAAGLPAYPKIAVEVDGHAFHEKTPEQVAYRNHRDRLLQRDGWAVLHFSWSEVTKNPEGCMAQFFDQVRVLYEPMERAYWEWCWRVNSTDDSAEGR
jgi:hypothetical protein